MSARTIARPGLGLIALVVALWSAPAPVLAVPFVINYGDGPTEGFNDPTRGAARKSAFAYAVQLWSDALGGNVPIGIDVTMDPLGGGFTSAVVAQAQPISIHSDFNGAPQPATWYVAALANELAGRDLDLSSSEIQVIFNSDIDGSQALGDVSFYYGTDGNAGSDIDFVTVALHEIGHGLGFIHLIDPVSGGWFQGDMPGTYDRNLVEMGVAQFDAMTDAQRKDAITSSDVFFNGPQVLVAHGSAAMIYAPNPYAVGSSISHFDPSLTPDELMEPVYTGPNHNLGLTLPAMLDMGWPLPTPTPTVTSTTTPTPVPSATPTSTATPSRTPVTPMTPSRTRTPTRTATPSHTRTRTRTLTRTPTGTITRRPSVTQTATVTQSHAPVTNSPTPTDTPTPEATATETPTAIETPLPTPTETATPEASATATESPSPTPSSSSTATEPDTVTPTLPPATATASATATVPPSPTASPTAAPTATATVTASATAPLSPTARPTLAPTASPTASLPPSPTPIPCVGDCRGDGTVSVDELVISVDVLLGTLPADDCRALRADHGSAPSVADLVTAVGNSLHGCPTH